MISLHKLSMSILIVLSVTIFFMRFPANASVTLPITAIGSGTVTITPIEPPLVIGEISITFSSFTPFPLTTGFFREIDDLTIPTFPERVLDTFFSLTAPNGDSLSGTFVVSSSEFIGPLTEHGSGIFTITNGTGIYAGATGGGNFFTENIFTNSTLAFGLADAEANGFVTLPTTVTEPSTLILFGTGLGWLLSLARVYRTRPVES